MTVQPADGFLWSNRGSSTDDHLGYAPHEAGFEPLLRSLLPQGGVFLDVGAHVGHWTIRLAGQASRVIAIEPNPDTAATLQANLDTNRITNVEIHNVAAWDCYTSLSLQDPNYRHAGGSTRTLPDQGGLIPGMPLDAVLSREPRIDLVKLDVEGSDLHALRGLQETLQRCKPVMFIEDHSALGYYDQADLLGLLAQLAYVAEETTERYMSAHYWLARPSDY